MNKAQYIGITISFLAASACSDDSKVSLTREDRIAIDTLSAKRIEGLRLELDKRCLDSADALRQRLKDSLYVVRKQDISRQIPGIAE